MKKIAAAFACLAFLAACSPEPAPLLQPDFGPASRINLDVRTISLADRSNIQSADSPYNTEHFQPTIADAVRQWASGHLQAVGSTGNAIVIIKDASLTAQGLSHDNDWFTRNQASKYIAHAEVEIQVKGRGDNYGMVSAQATRYETLPENPTASEKQNAYMTVLNGLMRDLGNNLDNGIREHLKDYVITAPIEPGTRAAPAPVPTAPAATPSPVPAQ